MKLAIIAPTALLDKCNERSHNFHLVLAHECINNHEYIRYYVERSMAGDHIILDNGAYELGNSIDGPTLLAVAEQLHPAEIVCPDVMFDKDETVAQSVEFMRRLKIHELPYKPLVVPQGTYSRNSKRSF